MYEYKKNILVAWASAGGGRSPLDFCAWYW